MHFERTLRSKNYWRVYKDLVKKAYGRLAKSGIISEETAQELIEQLLDYWVDDTKVVVNGKEVKECNFYKTTVQFRDIKGGGGNLI